LPQRAPVTAGSQRRPAEARWLTLPEPQPVAATTAESPAACQLIKPGEKE